MHRFDEYFTSSTIPQTLEDAKDRLKRCENTLTHIRHDINHLSFYITAASVGAFMEYYSRIRSLWMRDNGIRENGQWIPDIDENISVCEIEDMPRWAVIKFRHFVGVEGALTGKTVYFLLGINYYAHVDLSAFKKGSPVKWKEVVFKDNRVRDYPSPPQFNVFMKDYMEKKQIFDDFYHKQGKEPPKATAKSEIDKLLDPLIEKALNKATSKPKTEPKFKLVE